MVDGRDAHPTDRTDHVLRLLRLAVLLEPTRHDAHHCACVLLLEVERLDVGVLQVVAFRVCAGAVDDREVDVRELGGHGADRLLHEEAHADHQVVAFGGEVREVGHVFASVVRFDHVVLDAEVRLRLLQADESQVVEALVVEATDVGDESDLVLLRVAATAVTATTRHGQHQYRGSHTQELEPLVRHPRSLSLHT